MRAHKTGASSVWSHYPPRRINVRASESSYGRLREAHPQLNRMPKGLIAIRRIERKESLCTHTHTRTLPRLRPGARDA
jgi:hypothetical protein